MQSSTHIGEGEARAGMTPAARAGEAEMQVDCGVAWLDLASPKTLSIELICVPQTYRLDEVCGSCGFRSRTEVHKVVAGTIEARCATTASFSNVEKAKARGGLGGARTYWRALLGHPGMERGESLDGQNTITMKSALSCSSF